MKFGKQLQGTMVPEWSSYYMDYKALKKEIKQLAAAEAVPSHVKVERFVEQLGSQLDGVNAFFKAEEASVMAKWRTIDLIMMDSISPEDKQEMTEWLRARLQTNAGAPGVEAPRASRNQLGLFCDVYDAAQKLRQYVAINYVGFVKGMKKFEKKTSLSVGHIFMPRLQRTTFFNSPKLAILLAEVDCSAKDLLLRLGLQAGDMQSEFRCGLCSEVMRQPVRRLPLQLRPAAAAQLTPRLRISDRAVVLAPLLLAVHGTGLCGGVLGGGVVLPELPPAPGSQPRDVLRRDIPALAGAEAHGPRPGSPPRPSACRRCRPCRRSAKAGAGGADQPICE